MNLFETEDWDLMCTMLFVLQKLDLATALSVDYATLAFYSSLNKKLTGEEWPPIRSKG